MILRPLDAIPATSTEFLPAWSVVEQSQRHITDGCWMITQPSHAALAGEVSLLDQFPVVACDPTQSRAVARAREGQSYIIQGPPGTGKSQTITNLIAQLVVKRFDVHRLGAD